MKKSELNEIHGGAVNLSVTFFNSVSRFITTIKGLGETIGSSIRRFFWKKILLKLSFKTS